MKANKEHVRNAFLRSTLCILVAGVLSTGCSKDKDNGPSKDAASEVAGTYVGTLTLIESGEKYYEAEIIATRTGENSIEIGPIAGEDYSNATPTTIPVGFVGHDVIGQHPNGSLAYQAEQKTLTLVTSKTAETDVHFGFEGSRK